MGTKARFTRQLRPRYSTDPGAAGQALHSGQQQSILPHLQQGRGRHAPRPLWADQRRHVARAGSIGPVSIWIACVRRTRVHRSAQSPLRRFGHGGKRGSRPILEHGAPMGGHTSVRRPHLRRILRLCDVSKLCRTNEFFQYFFDSCSFHRLTVEIFCIIRILTLAIFFKDP